GGVGGVARPGRTVAGPADSRLGRGRSGVERRATRAAAALPGGPEPARRRRGRVDVPARPEAGYPEGRMTTVALRDSQEGRPARECVNTAPQTVRPRDWAAPEAARRAAGPRPP